MRITPSASLAVLLLGALTACGAQGDAPAASAEASSAAISTNGVNATMTVDAWGGGYCANITLANTSASAVTSWTLVAQLNQSTLNNVWGGTPSLSGSQLTIRPVDYNAAIAPGASVGLGFCGTATGTNYQPALVSLAIVGGGGPTTCAVTVTKVGNGTITGTPGGIDCGSVCSASVPCGTAMTFTATPASGSTFAGWGGGCTGSAPCAVTLNAAVTVTATFNTSETTYPLAVTKAGTGVGTVTGPSINCGSTCAASFASGATVTLTATAAAGSTFAGWSGTCTGTASTCTASMTAARTATATFTATTTSTPGIRGINWADQRDNFVNGVLYVSGLGSSDNYSSASTVASRVIEQLYSITGANTVRMPINEPTVSSYWSTYTGAIDAALTKGNVILAYWAYTGGKPTNATAFYQMWDKVVAAYGNNPNAYFEVINEPYGYGNTDLNNLYNDWLNRYRTVPRGRVILDGAGLAANVPAVGSDSRLAGTLLGVHDYSFWGGFESENEWANHLAGEIGSYASRTVATEWGGPMGPGTKDGVSYGTIDYSIPSGSFFADYIRGVSSQLRTLGIGSVYWPGLRDGDWYSLTRKSGSGSSITLSLVNPSGLARLQYAWGIGDGGGTYVQIRNAATGLNIDGLGSTTSGSNVGQSSATSSGAQWVIENSGNYVRIRNRATGLYLDGMGRTANGSATGQYSSSGSTAQQWSVLTDANNVTVRNRATGLFLDGMGRTASGSAAGQYSASTSTNQRWKIIAAQ